MHTDIELVILLVGGVGLVFNFLGVVAGGLCGLLIGYQAGCERTRHIYYETGPDDDDDDGHGFDDCPGCPDCDHLRLRAGEQN